MKQRTNKDKLTQQYYNNNGYLFYPCFICTSRTTTHSIDLALCRRVSNIPATYQTAGMTPTAPLLQWLALPQSSVKACGPKPHPRCTIPIGQAGAAPLDYPDKRQLVLLMTNFVMYQ